MTVLFDCLKRIQLAEGISINGISQVPCPVTSLIHLAVWKGNACALLRNIWNGFFVFLIITLVRHDNFILWEEPCKGASVTALTTTRHMRCCCCGFPRIVTQWEGFALLKINRRTFYHVITQHFLVLGNYVIELLQKYLTIGLLIWKQTFILSFLWQNNSAVLQHLATKHQRVREEGERWLP